jgi:hypothetical protein
MGELQMNSRSQVLLVGLLVISFSRIAIARIDDGSICPPGGSHSILPRQAAQDFKDFISNPNSGPANLDILNKGPETKAQYASLFGPDGIVPEFGTDPIDSGGTVKSYHCVPAGHELTKGKANLSQGSCATGEVQLNITRSGTMIGRCIMLTSADAVVSPVLENGKIREVESLTFALNSNGSDGKPLVVSAPKFKDDKGVDRLLSFHDRKTFHDGSKSGAAGSNIMMIVLDMPTTEKPKVMALTVGLTDSNKVQAIKNETNNTTNPRKFLISGLRSRDPSVAGSKQRYMVAEASKLQGSEDSSGILGSDGKSGIETSMNADTLTTGGAFFTSGGTSKEKVMLGVVGGTYIATETKTEVVEGREITSTSRTNPEFNDLSGVCTTAKKSAGGCSETNATVIATTDGLVNAIVKDQDMIKKIYSQMIKESPEKKARLALDKPFTRKDLFQALDEVCDAHQAAKAAAIKK